MALLRQSLWILGVGSSNCRLNSTTKLRQDRSPIPVAYEGDVLVSVCTTPLLQYCCKPALASGYTTDISHRKKNGEELELVFNNRPDLPQTVWDANAWKKGLHGPC